MRGVGNVLKTVLLAVAIGAVCLLTLFTANFLRKLSATVDELHYRMVGTSQNLNAVLIQTGLITNEIREAAEQEKTYWQHTSKNTDAAVAELRRLVSRTDGQLNSEFFPAATQALRHTDQSIVQLQHDSDASLRETDRALAQLTVTLGHVDTLVQNPDISKTLGNVQDTTAHLAATSADVEKKVHQLVAPASWIKRAALLTASIAGRLLRL